ncbi:MAG TPA: SipW-dependent-type signal peptide-containing protein [Chloroflexota bacterium]|nr:SipW-dependent-type signal peptide-containing protein [Chloroflexota bacterium]
MNRLQTVRNLMLSMLVLGIASSVVGVGTFATFNASTTSTNNTFSSATISFQDVLNAGGAGNTCSSTAGAAATGSGCTVALGSLSTMVPGDSKFGRVVLTNNSNVAVSVALSVTDSASNALTTTSIGTAGTSPTSAGLGLIVLQCQTSGGADESCGATDASGKVKILYGSCTGNPATISVALPLATTSFSTASLTDNGIKVNTTECYGGNTGSGLASISNASLSSSLAVSGTLSLAHLIYLPPSVSSASMQNLSGNSLTYTWTASSLAGTSN